MITCGVASPGHPATRPFSCVVDASLAKREITENALPNQTTRADVTVVIQTVGRSTLLRAIQSVADQTLLKGATPRRVDIWIGIDQDRYGQMAQLREEVTRKTDLVENLSVHWLDIGYSTSLRGAGVHTNMFGGSMRTVLSFLARSERIAYLDDDDWWHPRHLELMLKAIQDKTWAYSACWYADSEAGKAITLDRYESAGPDRGWYWKSFGGFIRPSAMMIDKIRGIDLLALWSSATTATGGGEDRLVFSALRQRADHGYTGQATVYYSLDETDGMHKLRMKYIRMQAGLEQFELTPRTDSLRNQIRQDAVRSKLTDTTAKVRIDGGGKGRERAPEAGIDVSAQASEHVRDT